MKKTLAFTIFIIASLAVLAQSGVLDALLAFLLVGAIPGTSYSIPSGFMLLLMTVVLWLIVARLLPIELYTQKTNHTKSKAKKSTPRRRFSQI